MKNVIYNHGELIIRRVDSMKPSGKELKTNEDIKVADSETTGNFHMLQNNPGVTVFHDEDIEKFFVSVEDESKIYCALDARHTDLKLLKGDYEISIAEEYDHLRQNKRNVLD